MQAEVQQTSELSQLDKALSLRAVCIFTEFEAPRAYCGESATVEGGEHHVSEISSLPFIVQEQPAMQERGMPRQLEPV